MICKAIQKIIHYGIKKDLITKEDELVVRNAFIEVFQLEEWTDSVTADEDLSIDEILKPLVDYACAQGIIADTANSRDLFDTKLMGILTPMPREVIAEFKQRYEDSPREATDWYYEFSKALNYVRAGRIAKDLKWKYECEYGVLDITINCSKPEKDPRDIAAAKQQKAATYPMCQLCPENAGFAGHINHPARQNLRPIPMCVAEEDWQLQYSPYGYYDEHCIFFNKKHVPMKIDAAVFTKLFDIIDYLPHYFVGSNADLPIVGGSILSHEHFQGGRYTFAMETAEVEKSFEISKYPTVKAGIVKWPMSVIRLSSENRDDLAKCCDMVLECWRQYSDTSVQIYAETDGVPHNTVTPIARKNGNEYECDLVLRNNYTTEERPLGLFHPNPALHHIKKENIGLIEVMGLAVLPSRLARNFDELEKVLVEGENASDHSEIEQHFSWIADIRNRYSGINKKNAKEILEQEIGKVFLEVLEDAGVFKRNAEGTAAFLRFVEYINK